MPLVCSPRESAHLSGTSKLDERRVVRLIPSARLLPHLHAIWHCLGREPSGNKDAAGNMPVAFPIRPPAGEEGIVRRGLDVAVYIECPRRDLMLAGGWCSPIERPKPPGV